MSALSFLTTDSIAPTSTVMLGISDETLITPLSLFPVEQSVASAATCKIGEITSDKVLITGTTTITSFGSAIAGLRRYVRFDNSLSLIHNSTSLILPGKQSVQIQPGDTLEAFSAGNGNWRVIDYTRANGMSLTERTPFKGTVTLNVSPGGNNNNDGLTQSTAVKDQDGVYNFLRSSDLKGYSVVVSFAPGTYYASGMYSSEGFTAIGGGVRNKRVIPFECRSK